MENLNRTNLWIAAVIVSQFAWAGAVIACYDNNSPLERNEEPNAVACEPQRQPGLDERGLLILSMMPILWLIVKCQSPGPLFFKQQRTGLNGENFMLYKFRSMHVNADADRLQATKDDPRKFPFGEFMRKTNIDELPQFFNVLKGDMSIVGPRPSEGG